MSARSNPELVESLHLVVVRREPSGAFTARVPAYPEISAAAATEADAIEQARQALAKWLATARVVYVKVQVPRATDIAPSRDNGISNDEEQRAYLDEIRRYRDEADERFREEQEAGACSNSSSTPTT
jgi:predicted RNase H-like HicB family nuclease